MVRRLIERGLMFGDLVRVDSPVLVERYRRALRHLTGQDTEETEFHVDISGFSPEVGEGLGEDYLNAAGFNRRFILVDLAQRGAPLLNARFSTSRSILQRFIDGNEAELLALTARDAVAGELVSSQRGAGGAAGLLDIRRVTVEADTTGGAVATAEKLQGLVARFKAEPDAWWDDRLIEEMAALAGVTGDLSRNPVRLRAMAFEQGNFWTALFGGAYVFRDAPRPGVIAAGDSLGALPIEVLGIDDRSGVARFLDMNDLAEPLVTARGPEVAAILRARMDMIVADVAAREGMLPEGADARELRGLARRLLGRLPPEWDGLAALAAWAEEGARWPRITSEHPAYFHTLRARRGPDMDLVTQLLAELTPLDVRGLFAGHKELFYRLYRTWPEAKQAWAAAMLEREEAAGEAGARPAPGEAPREGPWGRAAAQPDEAERLRAMLDRVGPWGALGRR